MNVDDLRLVLDNFGFDDPAPEAVEALDRLRPLLDDPDPAVYTGRTVSDYTLPRITRRDDDGEYELPAQRPETWRERAERAETELDRLRPLAAVLADLDRCEHGRHEGDVCSGCGGPSVGNPVPLQTSRGLLVDRQIGYSIDGTPIVIPAGGVSTDAAEWRPERRRG